MGNRCSRYIARKLVDTTFQYIVLPLTLTQLLERLPREKWDDDRTIDDGDSSHFISIDTAITILTVVIMVCGFTRSVLPFMFSFLGSAFGRKTTYNTYNAANYRWTPIQHILEFHETSGVYQDTVLDSELYTLAKQVATVLGKSNAATSSSDGNAVTTHHQRLQEELKFVMVGAGHGGYAVYKKHYTDSQQYYTIRTTITLHVTPYGPSILNIMPMYIVLERQQHVVEGFDSGEDSLAAAALDLVDPILSAATTPITAVATGYTYNGAFFKSQEWAALVARYYEELESYNSACRKLGTRKTASGRKRRQTKGGADGYFTSNYTSTSPPNNLRTLKEYIRSGHIVKRKRKDLKRNKQLLKEVNNMISTISTYQKHDLAPKRIILYLEGLDCSGKSSTAGLICNSLENCGYTVATIQHNRPPTPFQRSQPWMSRCRFEYPDDVIHGSGVDDGTNIEEDGTAEVSGGVITEGDTATTTTASTSKTKSDEYMALVWDRGPAGDFVYGKLDELNLEGKLKKYGEFRQYDKQAFHQDGILFFKLLFVSDKDSIASTLGKRLAHVHIVNDLRTWLYSNSNLSEGAKDVIDEGLQEIELHIDPTDFIAFNQYESNLSKFTSFARNTEWFMYQSQGGSNTNTDGTSAANSGEGDDDDNKGDDSGISNTSRHSGGGSGTAGGYQYYNPWIVINTSKRHPARLGLLKAFRDQLSRYSVAVASSSSRRRGIFPPTFNRVIMMDKIVAWLKYDRTISQKYSQSQLGQDYIEQRDHGVSVKATFQSLILLGLVLFYANITWKFDLHDYV